jgi:hypothetical protein
LFSLIKRHNGKKERGEKRGKKLTERNKKVLPREYDLREVSKEIAKFNRAVVPVDELRLDIGYRLRAAVYSGPAERLVSKGTCRGKMNVVKHVHKPIKCLQGRPEILEDAGRRTPGAY